MSYLCYIKYVMKHQKRWFINHIGKTIYRGKTTCTCKTCDHVSTNGLMVGDKFHADYLYMVQFDLDINYRDKK